MARNHVGTIDTFPRAVVPRNATKNCRVLGDGLGGFVCEELAGGDGFALLSNLASTVAGKGSALIGHEGGTTVKAALDTLTTAASTVQTTANTASAVRIQKRTMTLAYAAMSGLAGGVTTYTLGDSGGALPASARIAGFSIEALTGFDDGAAGTFNLELGVAGVADVMASTDVKAGSAAAPRIGTVAGLGYFGAPAIGTPSIKLTGSVDLNTLTAGTVTVAVFYFVLA